MVAIDRDRNACVFDPSSSAGAIVEELGATLGALEPATVGLYSLAVQTTEPSVRFATVPKAEPGPRVRPPAVAGTFYPAEEGRLREVVDELLRGDETVERWPAVMVPHAGLRFSGRLAAEVLRRVEIPGTVIVIGPKHTRMGVDWAVAPNESWAIPGAMVAGDPELARELAEEIPGLKLDAAAHRKEHAIEVELPILSRLSPDVMVVGIAIGGGGWKACRVFAEGLARVIERMPEKPLLVISSDMNHFATDAETRRLDEIALEAMERLDPEHLLGTVREHDISMCGVLPAVIVMETLRRLGGLTECERVGYATSADATGDTGRVVGYAGMLLR